jgi:hypothetical protein
MSLTVLSLWTLYQLLRVHHLTVSGEHEVADSVRKLNTVNGILSI